MHSQCGSNLVWILPRNQKNNKNNAFWCDFFTAKFERKQNKKNIKVAYSLQFVQFYPPNWKEDQNKTVLLDDFIVCGFIVRYFFYCAIYAFVWYLTATVEKRPNKLEKKVFFAYPV